MTLLAKRVELPRDASFRSLSSMPAVASTAITVRVAGLSLSDDMSRACSARPVRAHLLLGVLLL